MYASSLWFDSLLLSGDCGVMNSQPFSHTIEAPVGILYPYVSYILGNAKSYHSPGTAVHLLQMGII